MSTNSTEEILEQRGSKYGPFAKEAAITQKLKKVLYKNCENEKLTNVQAQALEMICVKMSRIINGDADYLDNWEDIAGYAQLAVRDISGRIAMRVADVAHGGDEIVLRGGGNEIYGVSCESLPSGNCK